MLLPPDISFCLEGEMRFGGLTPAQYEHAFWSCPPKPIVDHYDNRQGLIDNQFGQELITLIDRDLETAPLAAQSLAHLKGLLTIKSIYPGLVKSISEWDSQSKQKEVVEFWSSGVMDSVNFYQHGEQLPFTEVSNYFHTLINRAEIAMSDNTVFLAGTDAVIEQFRSVNGSSLSPKKRVDKKQGRKPFLRALDLYKKIFGQANVELFLGGKNIEIKGEIFDYVLSKNGTDLLSHSANPSTGHIPYNLEIFNKEGVFLGKGCVVFAQTPVIDQIIAFTLHVQSGEEKNILNNCNLYQYTSLDKTSLEELEFFNNRTSLISMKVAQEDRLLGIFNNEKYEEAAPTVTTRKLLKTSDLFKKTFDKMGLKQGTLNFLMSHDVCFDELHSLHQVNRVGIEHPVLASLELLRLEARD